MSDKLQALILDEGELQLVRAVLTELGAPFRALRPAELRPPFPKVPLLVTSARLALRLRLRRRRHQLGELPTWIAFMQRDSKMQRRVLRQEGFDYMVPEKVHPAALRLILQQALYDGERTQRVMRVPYGGEVSLVGRVMSRRATLVDLSPRGCRLLSRKAFERGSSLTMRIPCSDPDYGPLQLDGKVVRRAPAPEEGGAPSQTALGVRFASVDGARRDQLKALLIEHSSGPKSFDGRQLRALLPTALALGSGRTTIK